LEKKPSTRFSQEPCLGVNVKSKRPTGRVASQVLVSFGDVRRMIVEDQPDRGAGRIRGVEKLEGGRPGLFRACRPFKIDHFIGQRANQNQLGLDWGRGSGRNRTHPFKETRRALPGPRNDCICLANSLTRLCRFREYSGLHIARHHRAERTAATVQPCDGVQDGSVNLGSFGMMHAMTV
jgi:hypothetical protein